MFRDQFCSPPIAIHGPDVLIATLVFNSNWLFKSAGLDTFRPLQRERDAQMVARGIAACLRSAQFSIHVGLVM